jgi:microcystin-dependent protein
MSYKDALGYENFTIPIATVLAYAGQAAPAGFLKCDGASYSASAYPDLFSQIEYTYGGSASNFNVPDLVTFPYIIGATTATAGTTTPGTFQTTTDINIAESNLPSLPTGFNVSAFNVTGEIGGCPAAVAGTSVLAAVGTNIFKTDTNQTNAAQFTTSGSVIVNAGAIPNWIPAGDDIYAEVTTTSLQMIYIIKARYAPEYTPPPASPFAYIDDFYLREPNGDFNPKISGFIFPSNITPL